MSEAHACPLCGSPVPPVARTLEAGAASPTRLEVATQADQDGGIDLPPVPLLAPGSNDDDFLGASFGGKIAAVEPDPILGEFVTPSSSSTLVAKLGKPPRSGSSAQFPALDLGSRLDLPQRTVRDSEASRSDPDDEEDDEPEGHRTPFSMVLLLSYASAVTLALGWSLWKERGREKTDPVEIPLTTSAPPAPESARQSGLSRKVEPPEPMLGEHTVLIGQPLAIGSLEVTPIDVKRQDVTLERSNPYAKPERRVGGRGAFVLRLKLTNRSNDTVFAPLDQAYVRERGKGLLDTFIQTVARERIYPFPLALASEWSIVGQSFDELRPGESRVVTIASVPDAPPDSAGPFTWRVRLRTGLNRSDAIGFCWTTTPVDRPKPEPVKEINRPKSEPLPSEFRPKSP